MSHLTDTRWHGYETEPRTVDIAITSDLNAGQITAASLRITDQAAVTLTPATATGGYALQGEVTLPAAGFYRWQAEVTDDEANTPIIVAVGTLRVDALEPVATP